MLNIETAINKLEKFYLRICLLTIYRLYSIFKIKEVRRKKTIKVLFAVTELGAWKTEELFIAMANHPRFEPVIGISASPENYYDFDRLKSYVVSKGYKFYNLDDYLTESAWTAERPDIVFYSKPYLGAIRHDQEFMKHLDSLFCHVPYAPNVLNERWAIRQPYYEYVWLRFFENDDVVDEYSPFLTRKSNIRVTGLPMYDCFLNYNIENRANVWKPQDKLKKKIIWAPHHTIGDLHTTGIAYSTFLDFADFMLEMAEKYQDEVQWAFKPHPVLYNKLLSVWGKERTDSYYEKWKNMSNTQLESGEYVDLFMQSDAMIHDCSSFTIEYQYTHNPVLYIVRDPNHSNNMTRYAAKAFDVHYKSFDKTEIEGFINNVIKGIDSMYSERMDYYNKYLLPPSGKNACENIINAILTNNQ